MTGVQPGATVILEVTASAPGNSEGDDFDFSYRVNGANPEPLGTLLAGTGTDTFTAALPASTSGSVAVIVVDTNRDVGARNTDTVSVSLIQVTTSGDPGNQPPTVSITAPTDGTTVPSDTELVLMAVADDPEDGDRSALISWSSDQDGSIGSRANASVILSGDGIAPKVHVITAEVTDSAGLPGTDSITVTVLDPVDQPPSVNITAPADGITVLSGTLLTFSPARRATRRTVLSLLRSPGAPTSTTRSGHARASPQP